MTTPEDLDVHVVFDTSDPEWAVVKWRIASGGLLASDFAKTVACIYLDLVSEGVAAEDAVNLVEAALRPAFAALFDGYERERA